MNKEICKNGYCYYVTKRGNKIYVKYDKERNEFNALDFIGVIDTKKNLHDELMIYLHELQKQVERFGL